MNVKILKQSLKNFDIHWNNLFLNLNFDFSYPHEVFTNKLTSNNLGFAMRCIGLGATFLIRNL